MGAVLGLVLFMGLFILYMKFIRAKDKLEDRVERRVLQATVLRDERAVGKALAEGWVIAYSGTPKQAIDQFLRGFSLPSGTIERVSDTEVTIGFEYGSKSFNFDTRELLLCRLLATRRSDGAAVAFSVLKNPMTTRTNEGARRLSEVARRAFS